MISINALIIVLLWQSAIYHNLNFSYIDEIVTLALGLYLIYALLIRRFKMTKNETVAFWAVICFYCTGALATLIHNYQNSVLFGLESGLFSIKCFICYFGASIWIRKKKISRKNLLVLLDEIEIPLMIVAVLLIVDQFLEIFPSSVIRFGIKSSYFIFEHPMELGSYGALSLLLCIYLRNLLNLNKSFWRNYVPGIIVILISGKYKVLGFLAFFLTAKWILPLVKKFKLRYIVIFVPLVLIVTHSQLATYLTNMTTNARGALYYYSIIIAIQFFPLGSGFGTFGTEFSRKRFSPIYHIYHMTSIWGLNQDNPYFITDTMWPAILGETGVIGIICIIVFFVALSAIIKQKLRNKQLSFVTQCVVIYALFESIAAPIFMSALGCEVFFIVALMLFIPDNLLRNKV